PGALPFYGFLGRLFFELHGVAGDGDPLAGLVVGGVAGRDDLQANHRALGAANQLDHFVQAPADHIDHLVILLADRDDLVRRRDLLLFSAGPAGTRRTTLTCSLSLCSTAPMPSRDRLMLMSKFSALSGDRYWVCGS